MHCIMTENIVIAPNIFYSDFPAIHPVMYDMASSLVLCRFSDLLKGGGDTKSFRVVLTRVLEVLTILGWGFSHFVAPLLRLM